VSVQGTQTCGLFQHQVFNTESNWSRFPIEIWKLIQISRLITMREDNAKMYWTCVLLVSIISLSLVKIGRSLYENCCKMPYLAMLRKLEKWSWIHVRNHINTKTSFHFISCQTRVRELFCAQTDRQTHRDDNACSARGAHVTSACTYMSVVYRVCTRKINRLCRPLFLSMQEHNPVWNVECLPHHLPPSPLSWLAVKQLYKANGVSAQTQ